MSDYEPEPYVKATDPVWAELWRRRLLSKRPPAAPPELEQLPKPKPDTEQGSLPF